MKWFFLTVLSTLFWFTINQQSETKNFLNEIGTYDVSELWMLTQFNIDNDTVIFNRPQPLGYIGENYQRFYIHITSIFRNKDNSREYLVSGKTKVKGNISSFMGNMVITESRTYIDGEVPEIIQGYMKGTYQFFEDPDKTGTGILKGTFQTDFHLDSAGFIKYNTLRFGADNFNNNQFEGTWMSYKTHVTKKCNWGDFRIPDSRELDNGAAEFSPSKNYEKYGWSNYRLSQGYPDKPTVKEARKIENSPWWE